MHKPIRLIAMTIAAVMAGCMSLEERLASNDPQVKSEAERELVENSRRTGNPADRVAAVDRVTDQRLLQEIALNADGQNSKEGVAAVDKLQHEAAKVNVAKSARAENVALEALSLIKEQKSFADVANGAMRPSVKYAAFKRLTDQELIFSVASQSQDVKIKKDAVGLLKDSSKAMEIAFAPIGAAPKSKMPLQMPQNLRKLKRGQKELAMPPSAKGEGNGAGVLVDEFIACCSDDAVFAKVVKEYGKRLNVAQCSAIKGKTKSQEVMTLIDGIEKQKILASDEMILKKIVQTCDEGRGWVIECDNKEQIDLMKSCALPETKMKFLYLTLGKGTSDPKQCSSSERQIYDELFKMLPGSQVYAMLNKKTRVVWPKNNKKGWGSWEGEVNRNFIEFWLEDFAKKLTSEQVAVAIKGNPEMLSGEYGELLLNKLEDQESLGAALSLLEKENALSSKASLVLVEKVDASKLSYKLYSSVKNASIRDAIRKKASPALKKEIAEAGEKAYKIIRAKAESLKGKTFTLDAFYLGMSFDELKAVFAYLYPDYEVEEGMDGSGSDADHVLNVPGQSLPFCFADVSDKKVWQFNFGKKYLKKWYKYDVQNYAEWAQAFSRENKVNLQYKMIDKETTVYEKGMSTRSYKVLFHQTSYQYKHNMQEYRLIYFGEEKEFSGYDGIGGALIAEQAREKLRYVRGDEGMLRVKVEKD